MPSPTRPSATELRRRAARLKLVVTDVDGVWTDGGVYYSEAGEVMKCFNIRDGMGVERLRDAGIQTTVMTGERSPSVTRRGEKLGLLHVYLGAKDKPAVLATALADHGVTLEETAYIGDDCNDLAVLAQVAERGLTGAPFDAIPEVRKLAHCRCSRPGGHGAFREFAEWILSLRAQKPARHRRRKQPPDGDGNPQATPQVPG